MRSSAPATHSSRGPTYSQQGSKVLHTGLYARGCTCMHNTINNHRPAEGTTATTCPAGLVACWSCPAMMLLQHSAGGTSKHHPHKQRGYKEQAPAAAVHCTTQAARLRARVLLNTTFPVTRSTMHNPNTNNITADDPPLPGLRQMVSLCHRSQPPKLGRQARREFDR